MATHFASQLCLACFLLMQKAFPSMHRERRRWRRRGTHIKHHVLYYWLRFKLNLNFIDEKAKITALCTSRGNFMDSNFFLFPCDFERKTTINIKRLLSMKTLRAALLVRNSRVSLHLNFKFSSTRIYWRSWGERVFESAREIISHSECSINSFLATHLTHFESVVNCHFSR